jgi:hypothetical protein
MFLCYHQTTLREQKKDILKIPFLLLFVICSGHVSVLIVYGPRDGVPQRYTFSIIGALLCSLLKKKEEKWLYHLGMHGSVFLPSPPYPNRIHCAQRELFLATVAGKLIWPSTH